MVARMFWAIGCSLLSAEVEMPERGGFHKRLETVREEDTLSTPEEARKVAEDHSRRALAEMSARQKTQERSIDFYLRSYTMV